ncbi:unnamed protein product [Diatraea saccharalis]|uniref:RZ-type domain-containing protein n=1 Tax=Diatraea saccharalis TaxID=40085 RepID=A0A9N9QZZ4_9NEOP|nr:unnamed protein product [Diatraea saccharalis]
MHFINLDILDMIGNYCKMYQNAKLICLSEEFLDQVKVLCNYIYNCVKKISEQQQEDIGREIQRMNSIIQFSTILDRCGEAKHELGVKDALEQAKSRVIFDNIYNEDIAVSALKEFEKKVKLSAVITKNERALIVKAMKFPKQGHWYKCPNGHIYCITECGGASQISKCNECGATIGGVNHRLLSTNTVAGEMDGAQHPAWSEQNNMANFDLIFD